MLDLKATVIAIGAAFAIGVTSAWWITADYKESKYQAVIAKMRLDAADALAVATRRALAIERDNNRLATELEVKNAEHRKSLDDVYADNLRLATEFAGLYDSNASASNCALPTESKSTTKPVAPATNGRLSDPLTKLLLSESRRADEAAAYAATCYQWVKSLREQESAR
jgi:hypothetical protein